MQYFFMEINLGYPPGWDVREVTNRIGMLAPWVAVHFFHSLHGRLSHFGVTKSILGKQLVLDDIVTKAT